MNPTRIVVLSDTHGEHLDYSGLPPVDVAIHCGDLTEESQLDEFKSAVQVLRTIPACIKLVIAGNHDFTLDQPAFQQMLADAAPPLDPTLVRQTYGDFGAAERLLRDTPDVKLLFEGTHQIELPNGALLTVYASPCTASKRKWGFTYDPEEDHEWMIQPKTDIVITHSPPKGLLDYTDDRTRAGSASLFAAVASTRPKLHCFGHIHEAWGAKLVKWRDLPEDVTPSHFTAIDNEDSRVLETLATLKGGMFDDRQTVQERELKRQAYYQQGYCDAGYLVTDSGDQTLFVNAAIESLAGDQPHHLPWMMEMDLPSSVAQRCAFGK